MTEHDPPRRGLNLNATADEYSGHAWLILVGVRQVDFYREWADAQPGGPPESAWVHGEPPEVVTVRLPPLHWVALRVHLTDYGWRVGRVVGLVEDFMLVYVLLR